MLTSQRGACVAQMIQHLLGCYSHGIDAMFSTLQPCPPPCQDYRAGGKRVRSAVGPGGRHAQEPGESASAGSQPGGAPTCARRSWRASGCEEMAVERVCVSRRLRILPTRVAVPTLPTPGPLLAHTHVGNGSPRGPPRPRRLRADLGPGSRAGLCAEPNALGLR